MRPVNVGRSLMTQPVAVMSSSICYPRATACLSGVCCWMFVIWCTGRFYRSKDSPLLSRCFFHEETKIQCCFSFALSGKTFSSLSIILSNRAGIECSLAASRHCGFLGMSLRNVSQRIFQHRREARCVDLCGWPLCLAAWYCLTQPRDQWPACKHIQRLESFFLCIDFYRRL